MKINPNLKYAMIPIILAVILAFTMVSKRPVDRGTDRKPVHLNEDLTDHGDPKEPVSKHGQQKADGIKDAVETIKDKIKGKEADLDGYLKGKVGFINKKYDVTIAKHKSITSFGVPYFLNYNVCEVNKYYHRFDAFEQRISLGSFFKIKNPENHLETCCMVIGMIGSKKFPRPERVLTISATTAKEIGFLPKDGLKNLEIKFVKDGANLAPEDAKCLHIRDNVYKL